MTNAAELQTGALIAGKYRVEYVLGRGGMGAVYLATNEDIGRRVAIKVLLEDFAGDETLLRRFRQEARTAAAIGHPGIVDVLDLGTTAEGAPFIVMEALEGMTLGARIARDRRMDVAESLAIIAEVLDALAAAHDKEILHRDLKPDNLFMVSRPVACVKILDFGISKLGTDEEVSMTRTGAIFGTPLYMSAEQARGAKHVTAASDLYSIGAILFQMLAGRTPFVGDSYNELVAALMNGPYTSIGELRKDLPQSLVMLIDRMLSRDPAERPASARDARTQLLEIGRQLNAVTPAKPIDEHATTLPPELAATASTAPPAAKPAGPTLAEVEPSAPTMAATHARATSFGADAHADPAAPRSRVAWIAGGAVIVGGAIAALVVMRGSHDAPVVVTTPPDAHVVATVLPDATEVVVGADASASPSEKTVAQTIPQTVVYTLHASPPETRWVVDGDAIGDCNPCVVPRVLGGRHEVSASAPGYWSIHRMIPFDRNGTLELSLQRPVYDAGVPDASRGLNTIDRSNPFDDARGQ